MGLAHFKTQKQCFKLIETPLENSTCFFQSSSYSRDSIIYKNDKEVNSPESESRKQKKERLMAGLKEVHLTGGLAAAGMQPSINGEDWAPQTEISSAVASTPASTRTLYLSNMVIVPSSSEVCGGFVFTRNIWLSLHRHTPCGFL